MSDLQVEKDMRRQRAIEKAVHAADRIIMDASDGSNEETNYLTGEVARQFVEKALNPYLHAIRSVDIGFPPLVPVPFKKAV